MWLVPHREKRDCVVLTVMSYISSTSTEVKPEKLDLKLDMDHISIPPSSHPERMKAILVDAVENCLLLNAKGELTSTDVLIDILTSYLIGLNGEDASLGDLLLDVNNYRKFPPNGSPLWQTLSLH